jgi:hypothetical protein
VNKHGESPDGVWTGSVADACGVWKRHGGGRDSRVTKWQYLTGFGFPVPISIVIIGVLNLYFSFLLYEEALVGKSFQDWIAEGEGLYAAAMNEYKSIEDQMEQLSQQLAAKKLEVNQIASVIGRQAVDGRGQPASAATTGAPGSVEVADSSAQPYTRNSIARALSGQPLRR